MISLATRQRLRQFLGNTEIADEIIDSIDLADDSVVINRTIDSDIVVASGTTLVQSDFVLGEGVEIYLEEDAELIII